MNIPTLSKHASFFILFNVLAICLVLYSYFYGTLDSPFQGLGGKINFVIVSFLVYHAACSMYFIFYADYRVSLMEADNTPIIISNLKDALGHQKLVSLLLVVLGLVGTVAGFIQAFSGLDPSNPPTVETIGQVLTPIIHGTGTAMYTTLVGSICYFWAVVNTFTVQRSFTIVINRLRSS